MVKKLCLIFWLGLLVCSSCRFRLKPFSLGSDAVGMEVRRYDRLESQYLMTGDFSALQQMNTDYPTETRILLENVLKLGEVEDPQINQKFLSFYQDSTLQRLISDAESQYASMDDINESLRQAFATLKEHFPWLKEPLFYSQIGSLDQSIVVGNGTVGISLDKYLGKNYPLYKRFYNKEQRQLMTRDYIVPDCLCFYLMSALAKKDFNEGTQHEKDVFVGKVMWICNQAIKRNIFKTKYVRQVEDYMASHKDTSWEDLMSEKSL